MQKNIGHVVTADMQVAGSHGDRYRYDRNGFEALGTLFHLEFNRLAATQGAVSVRLDGCVMHEYIVTALFSLNKTETLLVIEPFDFSLDHIGTPT